ncbi:DNA polymerase III subunit alpha [Coxiella endosymbiont of Amblyomma americanum]|uniref:DNA polymerase III subunit alpha n=1 Tax=Coxiella endosymbiont of Amblyomma americanum TaxID=325775 RepID=UPI00057D042D|nr:DNA polymerase III subunit alpha [Coxiella endosymbiont of Amblyomma americanum]AJC50538.1 DNA polymerase III subunit alpha [Coxiella endosymbiont of Amblyomma americanum]
MHPFIHLKVHTEYSIGNSVIRVDQLLRRVVELKMPAVALTDEVNLFALIKFYRGAISKGIKPIIGAELKVIEKKEIFYLSVLCQNQVGFHHLIQLLSRAYVNKTYQHEQACVQWKWLIALKEGLIILSGGQQGDVGQALLQNRNSLAKKRLLQWIEHFPDRFYLELHRTHRDREEEYTYSAIKLALTYNIPVVSTNDVRFLYQEDFEAYDTRVCIQKRCLLNDSNRICNYSDQQYLKSTEEMQELFSDIPEALENTMEIAKRCNVQISLNKVFVPKFPVPVFQTEEGVFCAQSKKGLAQRIDQSRINREYMERLEIEIDVITKMGLAGYFLIVADFVAWAKKNKIPVGPGRGSGAGSLVAYALGITELDPLEHELLFERFLNLERVSMPDFDVDFCMEKRDLVIDYVMKRYGYDAVAQIITYGTMAARAVLRDVGRVLGLPYGYIDKIAKLVPFELGMTLKKALRQEKILEKRYTEDDEVKNLIDLAMKLEGLVRNTGKHAGGVVISPTKLTDFVPLYAEPNSNHVVTQFDKDDIEVVGLVKFDFLGLRTLTIIKWAVQSINIRRKSKKEPALDISSISLEDKTTYDLLKSCATTAIFQLESRGMKELIRRLQPDNFSDIMALVALFRPGPLQSGMVDTFISCKHGERNVQYLHPDLKPILQLTYGVILYQEQVMQIAQVLSGYSLGAADVLRHAMGKKKPKEMAKQREIFIKGSISRGINANLANQLFNLMEKFSGYGFNKSHSAAYALITYQTAWLKAHYPAEFMAAVLSSDMDNTDKIINLIKECRDMDLTLLSPSINHGKYFFIVNIHGQIEYGLGAIKGVGESAISHIASCRETTGEFKGLFDLCYRVDLKKIGRRVLEPLIKSGAMDTFGVSRASLVRSLSKALRLAEQKNHNILLGQSDLFDNELDTKSCDNYEKVPEWNDNERLRMEKETLGFYISGHPLQAYEKEIKTIGAIPVNRLVTYSLKKNFAVIVGMVLEIRNLITRSGGRMAILIFEDQTGTIEVTVFSNLYKEIKNEVLEKNTILVVRGIVKKDNFSGRLKIIAHFICTLDEVRTRAKRILIRLTTEEEINQLLISFPTAIDKHPKGSCLILFIYQGKTVSTESLFGRTWHVKPSTELLNHLNQLYGKGKIELEY